MEQSALNRVNGKVAMNKQPQFHTLLHELRKQYQVDTQSTMSQCSTTNCENTARGDSPCAYCLQEELSALLDDVILADTIHRLTRHTTRAIHVALTKLGDE